MMPALVKLNEWEVCQVSSTAYFLESQGMVQLQPSSKPVVIDPASDSKPMVDSTKQFC